MDKEVARLEGPVTKLCIQEEQSLEVKLCMTRGYSMSELKYIRHGVRDLEAMRKLDDCIGDCDKETANAIQVVWDEIDYIWDKTGNTIRIDRWIEEDYGHKDWAFLDTFSDQEKVGLDDVADIVKFEGMNVAIYHEARPGFVNGDI